jgi:hypothetical protein
MDRRRSQAARKYAADDPAFIAQSMRNDFILLIGILDREAVRGRTCVTAGPRIADAKAAAQRGLQLSEKLLRLLGTPN